MANEKFLDLNGLTRYDRKIKSFVEGNSIVKCDTMPIASDRNFGQIIQYVGTTDATYTNGYFYKSIIDGDDNHVWQRVDIQPSIDPNNYYTKAQTDTMLGNLTMRGYSGVDTFNTNTNEPGVYFIRASGFSDGHGHTSFPSNYGLHPGTFFGVLYFLKEYDDAEAGEDLGYIYGISTDANNNGWVAKFRKVSGGNYIAYSGFESNNIINFLTTTTNQTGISGKKTFTTLPESSVVPTTDNQFVNKKYVDNINKILTTETTSGLTNITDTTEHTLITKTLDKGYYLFVGNIPVNYYAQTGREIHLKVYKNNVVDFTDISVINTAAYTINKPIVYVLTVTTDNTIVELKCASSVADKRYDIGSGFVQFIKLRDS